MFAEIKEPFCDIFSLRNESIIAYPNFLAIGQPTKTLKGILLKKNSYLKIDVIDLENWYFQIEKIFQFFIEDENEEIDQEDEIINQQKEKILGDSINCSFKWNGITDIGKSMKGIRLELHIGEKCEFSILWSHDDFNEFVKGLSVLALKPLCFPNVIYDGFGKILSLASQQDNGEFFLATLTKQKIEDTKIYSCSDLPYDESYMIELILRYKKEVLVVFLLSFLSFHDKSDLLLKYSKLSEKKK